MYDPHLGRFIQPDTIVPEPFDSQAFNRYSYVTNNPFRYIDPSGYEPVELSSFRVNVFAPYPQPAPYTGGPLPYAGPTYNNYNPVGPASLSTVPQQSLFSPAALPTQATRLGITQASSSTVNPVSAPSVSLTAGSSSQLGDRQLTTDDVYAACLLFIQTGCATDRLGELFGAGPEFMALGLGLNVDHSKINKQAKK